MAANEKLGQLRKKAMRLPLTPGVYIMKNKAGKIIYIGKAKVLKNRVSQYFGSDRTHPPKVRKMVEQVDDFDYILTDSEFEALVLECSLIKQNMPKYNILLKDDKGYSYIKITPHPWGNLSACFRRDTQDAVYLGPYTGNFSVSTAVEQAKEIFKLPTCGKVFPRDIGKNRPCLNYFIGRCSAPCAGKIGRAEYEENLDAAVAFIKGGSKSAVQAMKDEMQRASENLEFEKAAKLRDRIRAVERIAARQKVVKSQTRQQDVFAISLQGEKACLAVLNFRDGLLSGTEHFIVDVDGDLPQMRQALLISYYAMQREIPPRVLLDGPPEDTALLEQFLQQRRGKKIEILLPQKGESAQLVAMCHNNASQKLGDYFGRKGAQTSVLDELAKLLRLQRIPEYIEAYDISHTAGADNVAGMVVFKNARPLKSAYRRFAIQGFDGQDDYGSMREVLSRRFNRYQEEQASGEGFGRLPDLILLDGGQGQVNAVLPVVEAFGLEIPVFGMVKDTKHRTRAIAGSGEEIEIKDGRRVFTLISSIQEEVHRFAITYHKTKHAKAAVGTTLTRIPGIGEKKAKALLRHFKTMKAIRAADEAALCAVPGLGKRDAEAILSYFSNADQKENS